MDHMTAKVSCFARAYHTLHNTVPIFSDTKAQALLGADYDAISEHMSSGIPYFLPGFQGTPEEGLRQIVDQQLSPSVLARSAYCEQMLQNEIRLGCRQYILFAAGYDTFGLRNENSNLSVFELDLPEMLADKEARIQSAGLKSCAHPLPCDLSKNKWTLGIFEKGFDADRKSFSSLLGLSYYLSKGAFQNLVYAIGTMTNIGSAICFDYPSIVEGKEARINQALARGAGEEMKACYSYREMESLLSKYGYLIYEHLSPVDMTKQYFNVYNAVNPVHPMKAPKGVCYLLAVKHRNL